MTMLDAMLIGMGMVLIYGLVALVIAMRSKNSSSESNQHHHA